MTFKSKLRHLTNKSRSHRKKKTKKLTHIGGATQQELNDAALAENFAKTRNDAKNLSNNLGSVIKSSNSELAKLLNEGSVDMLEIAGTRTKDQASKNKDLYKQFYNQKDGFVGAAGVIEGSQKKQLIF